MDAHNTWKQIFCLKYKKILVIVVEEKHIENGKLGISQNICLFRNQNFLYSLHHHHLLVVKIVKRQTLTCKNTCNIDDEGLYEASFEISKMSNPIE